MNPYNHSIIRAESIHGRSDRICRTFSLTASKIGALGYLANTLPEQSDAVCSTHLGHDNNARKSFCEKMTECQWVCNAYSVDDAVVVNDARVRREEGRRPNANGVLEMHVLCEDSATEIAHVVTDVSATEE